MREFLNHYGLWAPFLIALLENDVSFIAIGVVARLGDGGDDGDARRAGKTEIGDVGSAQIDLRRATLAALPEHARQDKREPGSSDRSRRR